MTQRTLCIIPTCHAIRYQLTAIPFVRYKCSTSQYKKLFHDDTQFLLAIAFADNALYGLKSPADLWEMEIPAGDDALPLQWNKEALHLPILCNATKNHGVTEEALPKTTFEKVLRSVLNMSGYFGTATIHAIRRALGKKVDGELS